MIDALGQSIARKSKQHHPLTDFLKDSLSKPIGGGVKEIQNTINSKELNVCKLSTGLAESFSAQLLNYHLAEKLNCPGHLVCYTSNYTSKEDLLFALKTNATINLDDLSLVDTLSQVANENGASLVIVTEDSAKSIAAAAPTSIGV